MPFVIACAAPFGAVAAVRLQDADTVRVVHWTKVSGNAFVYRSGIPHLVPCAWRKLSRWNTGRCCCASTSHAPRWAVWLDAATPASGAARGRRAPPLVMRLTEWDEYTGRFEATDRVEVRARVNGYLDSIHFRDGAIVKPGDLLFVIDPRPYAASRRRSSRRRPRADARGARHHRLHPGEALFAIRGISQEEFDRRFRRGRKRRRP